MFALRTRHLPWRKCDESTARSEDEPFEDAPHGAVAPGASLRFFLQYALKSTTRGSLRAIAFRVWRAF